jgi:hypothetical protein
MDLIRPSSPRMLPSPSSRRPNLLVAIRHAETETSLRTFANPSFRAAGLDMTLVRSNHPRDVALNSFTKPGNPVFMGSPRPPPRRAGGPIA